MTRATIVIVFSLLILWAVQSMALTEGIIQGQVAAAGECHIGDAQVWVAQDRTLIYQVDVPPGGTFKFHVIPGSYTLSAKNEKGCFSKQDVEVSKDGLKNIELDLTTLKRKPAQFLDDGRFGQQECLQYPCPWDVSYGPNYIQPQWNPWWMYYGQQYPNFYYPGPWTNYGLNQNFYPGGGGMAFDKPNLYLSGSKNLDVQIKVEFERPEMNWLTSVPAYDVHGWQVKLNSDGELVVGQTNYKYLFYDFRGNDDELQNEKGYCAPRNSALAKISSILKDSGFLNNEIKDFEEYWRIKMPPNDLCVYPQDNAQLNKVAGLQIFPKPDKITRLLFVVTQKGSKNLMGSGKFNVAPREAWLPSHEKEMRDPSNKKNLEVREWGVAFLFSR